MDGCKEITKMRLRGIPRKCDALDPLERLQLGRQLTSFQPKRSVSRCTHNRV